MRTTVSHKSKQFFAVVIKLAIVIGAAYFIYDKLFYNKQLDFGTFLAQLKASNLFNVPTILILFLATISNWFFEIIKWKTLVNHVRPISIWESTAQSLGGLTASLFTPNRIGEYGAKALYFKKSQRKHVFGLNFLGNTAQLTVTLFFGLIGFSLVAYEYSIELPWDKIIQMCSILVILGALLFLGTKQKRFKIKGYSWSSLKRFLHEIPSATHMKNMSLSIVRYFIFSHQFYFLLILFGVNHSYLIVMSAITAMYLITSLIPMLFIFDVIVKGSVAIWIFGYLDIPQLHILSVVSLMWILNFVFPSVVGSYFVMKFNSSFEEDQIRAS